MARAQLILDRYQPLGEAGSGGFGTVRVAWDTRIQRKVAIKCIELGEPTPQKTRHAPRRGAQRQEGFAPEGAVGHAGVQGMPDPDSAIPDWADPDRTVSLGGIESASTAQLGADDGYLAAVRAFSHVPGLDEARTAAMLTDYNIVSVYDFEVQGGMAYLIMEYVDGMTLSEFLSECGDRMTLDAVAAVFSGVAHALEAAHENRVLHLDIKPDNILIDRKGRVKVTDFGLARLAGATGFGSAGGGTVGYMPLEQMRGESLDARCDEWALASVAYEMLTGTNPFIADTLAHAESAIEDAELVLPSLCWDDLDEQADDVLFYALDPSRDERYETVADFAEEMGKFLGNAKQGTRELALLVNGDEDEGDAQAPDTFAAPRAPLGDRVGPRARTAAARAVAALGSAAVGGLAFSNMPFFSGFAAPAFWAPVLVAAVLGAVLPSAGALVSYAALAVALVAQGQPGAGMILVLAAAAWWWFVGRGGAAQANAALVVPLAGAIGADALAPLAAGMALRPVQALATAGFSAFVATVLASLGSGNLIGWDALVYWDFAGRDVQASLLSLATRPETWCMAAGWLVAAGALALFRLRRTRAFSLMGVAAAAAALIVAGCLAAWFASGGATWSPSAGLLASILGCSAAAGLFAAVFPPGPGIGRDGAAADEEAR